MVLKRNNNNIGEGMKVIPPVVQGIRESDIRLGESLADEEVSERVFPQRDSRGAAPVGLELESLRAGSCHLW